VASSCVAIENVRHVAFRAVRNLPEAHSSIEFWRKARFRRTMTQFVEAVYLVQIEGYTDRDFEELEDVVRSGLNLVQIRLAGLRAAKTQEAEQEHFKTLEARLHEAMRGIERGQHPDPAKRPTDDEMMQMLAERLRSSRSA
jgi:hypothetical protein